MSGFADTINRTEIPDAPEEGRYEGPPRIRWANGAISTHPSLPDAPGEFYVSEKTLGGIVPGEPWREVKRYENEVGYVADELSLIILASKSQPYYDKRNEKGGWVSRVWQRTWEPGVSKSVQTEYLCLVEGFYSLDDVLSAEQVVFAVKGMVGKRMKELLDAYRDNLLHPASAIASDARKERIKLPQWSFRIPIGPEIDAKKRFVFVDTGFGSKVQLPALQLPIDVTEETMNKLYVGDAMLTHGRTLYDASELWRTTQYTNKDEEGDQDAPAAKSNGSASQQDDRPTVPERVVFAQPGEKLTLEQEFEALDENALKSQQLGFGRRREQALNKLDWDTEFREWQEEQVIGKKGVSWKTLTAREQFMIVRQLERFISGVDTFDIPF